MLFDTHAHYDDEKFDDDRYEVITRAYENGVGYILNAASDMASAHESIKLSREFEYVYAAVGVHPHNVKEMNNDVLKALGDLASDSKVVAIGEIGLDYYYDFAPRELQRYWFEQQVDLAGSLGLPVIVHDRDSHEDVMKIIRNRAQGKVDGVFHNYTGSVEMARELLNYNFYLAFGGAVTFKNARKAVDTVKFMPLDRLLIETDCPYLTPEPHRGKRNESTYVQFVAGKIAEIRGLDLEDIAQITTENAKRLFGIS